MKYQIIYADPPWRYQFGPSTSRSIETKYSTMSLDEIAALPVSQLATDDAALLLWTTAPKLEESFRIISAWGFAYTSCAVWDKEILGMGWWFRGQHELLLVGRRKGSKPPIPSARCSSVFRERRTKHSKKPLCVYQWIERAWPAARKLELFARQTRPGWDVWGNEVTPTVELT